MIHARWRNSGAVLGNRDAQAAAADAATFILTNTGQPDGRLYRSFKDGLPQARFNAYLEDYAALVRGLIALLRNHV
ncbi:MAG: hypothetical protein R2854_00085 [Caldilineaceae bacterium]